MSITSFWDSPPDRNRERLPVEATYAILYRCGKCGANLLTSERRGARRGKSGLLTSVKCKVCGTENSLVKVKWSGVVD